MSIISITATCVGPYLVDGIPQYVGLSANVPSTIFYTLDGTTPDAYSSVYLEEIVMPTDDSSVRLRVLAVSGNDSGTLDVSFSSSGTNIRSPYRSENFGIGIAVDGYGIPAIALDGYTAGLPDTNGNYTLDKGIDIDIDPDDLEWKLSRMGPGGINNLDIIIPIGFPSDLDEQEAEISVNPSSTSSIYFNPKSLYITMDGRDIDQYNVWDGYKIINRPLDGTLDYVKYLNGRCLYESEPYISGGLVRTLYSAKNGISVSYYFDHNETRWIKSIQTFDPSKVPSGIGARGGSNPLVFKWIYNKRSSI